MEERLELFYGKPIDEILHMETQEVEWGTPQGNEEWYNIYLKKAILSMLTVRLRLGTSKVEDVLHWLLAIPFLMKKRKQWQWFVRLRIRTETLRFM